MVGYFLYFWLGGILISFFLETVLYTSVFENLSITTVELGMYFHKLDKTCELLLWVKIGL